jgi:hypothetical protein
VLEDRAVLLGAEPRRRLGTLDFLGAHDLALVDETREQLRLRQRPPVLETLAGKRTEDLAVGVEDRAVRVPEGTRFDLRGGQDEDSVCGC